MLSNLFVGISGTRLTLPENRTSNGSVLNEPEDLPLRPTIDAHHHLWQLGRFPYAWLAPGSPPRPFGDHSRLKRDYLVADYLSDMAGAGVIASVFVEANAGASGAAEVEWVDTAAPDTALPAAAIGSVDLRRPDIAETLAALARSPRMRGIRMSLCWNERPQWRFIDGPDVMLAPEFRRGMAELTRRGMVFDVLVVPGQLSQLAGLAHANPEQQIVINHLGTPWFETAADEAAWTAGMRECAGCANVAVKLSGLWPLDHKWRPERIAGPVRLVVDLFGPGRCLWASNYPVEKLMCPVVDQIRNLETVLEDLYEEDKDRIFRQTAERLYRIPPIAGTEPLVQASNRDAVRGSGSTRPTRRVARQD
jgi:predicted TIM-barrel fold metal-dependent hydrolase